MSFRPLDPNRSRFHRWGSGAPAPPELREAPPGVPAEEGLDDLLHRAREEGAAEARAENEAELAQLREAIEILGPALEDLAGLRRRTLIGLAEDVGDIVRLFAQRIVSDALALNPEALPGLVRDAVTQLPETEEITIAVSPQSAEPLSRALEPSLRDRIVVDPDIESGAVVRTRYASLDATLKTAEQGLESAVQGWLAEQWWVEGEGP